MRPRVELLFDPGCPAVDEARREIAAALRAAGLPERWEERQGGERTVGDVVSGSPTVIVDGRDVAGRTGGVDPAGASCRMYPEGRRMRRAPSREMILDALGRRRSGAARGGAIGAAGAASTGASAALVSAAATACCAGPVTAPLLVSVLGAGGAAWAAGLKPYSGWLLAGAGVLLAAGFYSAYGGGCRVATRGRDRVVRIVLWLSAALWLASAAVNLALR